MIGWFLKIYLLKKKKKSREGLLQQGSRLCTKITQPNAWEVSYKKRGLDVKSKKGFDC